ncbi:MAG: cupin domain-containing protein [Tannerellaceae bacterium]|nr:cupin domain-containing protein [Tannerellaceae bacterium]
MKTAGKTYLFEKNIQWEPMAKGVVRQILGYNENLMTVKVKFETGCVAASHSHPHSQTTTVVSGRFEFTVGDETQVIGTGDGVYIRPDVVHACKCLEAGIVIDSFSPMREDFLL